MEIVKQHLVEIIQLAESILNDTPTPPLTDEQVEFTKVIRNNAQRLNNMIAPVIEALPEHTPGQPFPGDMHEMRTPLVSIIGYADVFCAGVVGDIPEELATRYAEILKHGLHLRDRLETIYATIKAQLSDNPLIT